MALRIFPIAAKDEVRGVCAVEDARWQPCPSSFAICLSLFLAAFLLAAPYVI